MSAGKRKIVLPGGAGLVGQNLLVRLRERGFTDLVVIDKHKSNLDVVRRLHPDVTLIEADLAEPGPWQDRFAGADTVVMLQAQIGGENETAFARNNVASTRHVLEAMKRHGVNYVVHISSSVVESVASDNYVKSKSEQEAAVLESGIPNIVLRPTLMFGWFDRKHLGWLSRFMRRVPVFPIPGHGRYMRQPLHAGDFSNIIIACIEKKMTGGVYNISGLEKVDYVDIIRAIRKATHARAMILHIPYALFAFLLRVWALFDKNPPFTADQLKALVARDEFEVIDWPGIFGVKPTPFTAAIEETFAHPLYSDIVLKF